VRTPSRVSICVAAVVFAAGCGGGTAAGPPGDVPDVDVPDVDASDGGVADVEGPNAEDGISADEARRRGVFAGDHDVAVEVRTTVAGTEVVELSNVGRRSDTYLLRLVPSEAGTLATSEVTLGPDERFRVTFELHAPATLTVHSYGAGGPDDARAELARLELSP
jgi:hypothetical protein